jgi:hypothetical protein
MEQVGKSPAFGVSICGRKKNERMKLKKRCRSQEKKDPNGTEHLLMHFNVGFSSGLSAEDTY